MDRRAIATSQFFSRSANRCDIFDTAGHDYAQAVRFHMEVLCGCSRCNFLAIAETGHLDRCASQGGVMKQISCAGVACLAILTLGPAYAGDMPLKAPPKGACDPYKNYSCLDAYLGEDFWTRLVNYYRLEWGKDSAPSDPKAPPSRRAG